MVFSIHSKKVLRHNIDQHFANMLMTSVNSRLSLSCFIMQSTKRHPLTFCCYQRWSCGAVGRESSAPDPGLRLCREWAYRQGRGLVQTALSKPRHEPISAGLCLSTNLFNSSSLPLARFLLFMDSQALAVTMD